MKNQYFGDRRDLFKYDLLLDLVESHGSGRLTFVPMLTPDDKSGQGRLTQFDSHGRRPALYDFLKTSLTSGQRNIKRLRDITPKLGVEFVPFRDDVWFTHERRAEYFGALPSEYLAKSVIFFDPDIGLETGPQSYMWDRGPEKYLLYSELANIWTRASEDSVVVVYQHLQKDARKRARDVERRVSDVRQRLDASAWAIQWNDLAFIAAVRDGDLARRIRAALQRHAYRHALAFHDVAAEHMNPA